MSRMIRFADRPVAVIDQADRYSSKRTCVRWRTIFYKASRLSVRFATDRPSPMNQSSRSRSFRREAPTLRRFVPHGEIRIYLAVAGCGRIGVRDGLRYGGECPQEPLRPRIEHMVVLLLTGCNYLVALGWVAAGSCMDTAQSRQWRKAAYGDECFAGAVDAARPVENSQRREACQPEGKVERLDTEMSNVRQRR